jgi:universal stress protein A
MRITRILVPVDFSAYSAKAVRCASELARSFNAVIRLVTVVEDPLVTGGWPAELYTTEIAALQGNLVRDAERSLRQLVPPGPDNITIEVRNGPAAKQILAAALDYGADLIVMGTSGRSGLARVVMGSVTEKVVRLSRCPVLTVHADEPPATAERLSREAG